jgi:hypothetical protein
VNPTPTHKNPPTEEFSPGFFSDQVQKEKASGPVGDTPPPFSQKRFLRSFNRLRKMKHEGRWFSTSAQGQVARKGKRLETRLVQSRGKSATEDRTPQARKNWPQSERREDPPPPNRTHQFAPLFRPALSRPAVGFHRHGTPTEQINTPRTSRSSLPTCPLR